MVPSPTASAVPTGPPSNGMYPNTGMYYGISAQTAMYPTTTNVYSPPLPWMNNSSVNVAYPSQMYPLHPQSPYNPSAMLPYAMGGYGMPSYGNYPLVSSVHLAPAVPPPPPPPKPQAPPPPTAPYPSKR
jgi:hypothetical protein